MAIDQDALQNIDWVQVVLNGGPPCFHLEEGRFCLRAEKWSGHHIHNVHKFVSLAAYAAECVRVERVRCAGIARKHGEGIGEHCWNHENLYVGEEIGAETTCWEEIAAAIEREG